MAAKPKSAAIADRLDQLFGLAPLPARPPKRVVTPEGQFALGGVR